MSAENRQVGGNHYQKLGIQPLKFAMVNDWDAGAFSILKYLSRHRQKDGKKDIEKALHIVELRIEQVGSANRSCTALMNRISMFDYLESNDIRGDDRAALLLLDAWTYRGCDEDLKALIRVLNRILATY